MRGYLQLLKWVVPVGLAHAVLVLSADMSGGGDLFRMVIPILQVLGAALVITAALAGVTPKETRRTVIAVAIVVGVMPFGFMWEPLLAFLFFPACALALWLLEPRSWRMIDLPFLGQAVSLTFALFAAGAVPGMVGNRLNEDSTSFAEVLVVLAFLSAASTMSLLLDPVIRHSWLDRDRWSRAG